VAQVPSARESETLISAQLGERDEIQAMSLGSGFAGGTRVFIGTKQNKEVSRQADSRNIQTALHAGTTGLPLLTGAYVSYGRCVPLKRRMQPCNRVRIREARALSAKRARGREWLGPLTIREANKPWKTRFFRFHAGSRGVENWLSTELCFAWWGESSRT